MNKIKLREEIAVIKTGLINAPKTKYKIYKKDKKAAFARMERMFDKTLSYEENALKFYKYFHTTFDSLRYKTIAVCKSKLLKGMSGRTRLEAERAIYQSTDQSGKAQCGSTVEMFLYFFFKKAGINVEMGTDGRDLCVFTQNGKKWYVNSKHTVREKMNDNDCPIKVCWGYDPNNNCGGFSRQVLPVWAATDTIAIIVHPQGRMDVQNAANEMGLTGKFYSLDAGIKQIKKIDSHNFLAVA